MIVPSFTFVATAAAVRVLRRDAGVRRHPRPARISIDPDHVAALITPRTKAVRLVHFAGYAAPVDRLRELCDAHGLTLVEDTAHAPSADADGRKLGTFGMWAASASSPTRSWRSARAASCAPTIRELADRVRELASNSRHRFDDQRAVLAAARLAHLAPELAARRRLTLRYREHLDDDPHLTLPFAAAAVAGSSCYTMPVMLSDPARRDAVRRTLRSAHGIQTSVLYPAMHEFTAYRAPVGPPVRLPETERCARAQISLPLFSAMSTAQQDRVIAALLEEVGR